MRRNVYTRTKYPNTIQTTDFISEVFSFSSKQTTWASFHTRKCNTVNQKREKMEETKFRKIFDF
jgi:hypothetical protein